MKQLATFAFIGILSVVPGFGQTSQTDSQTLQAILIELRGIHNDVRLSQTTQILLAELELQQTAVNRAQEKRDNLRSTVAQLQTQQKVVTGELARFEENASTTVDPAEKKQNAQVQEQLKSQLTNLKAQEQDRSNELLDAEGRLGREQDALNAIQDQLNDVVKKLQPAGSQ
jgi:chromosome segregation ATPase